MVLFLSYGINFSQKKILRRQKKIFGNNFEYKSAFYSSIYSGITQWALSMLFEKS